MATQTATTLLAEVTRQTLEKARYSQSRVNIPNNSRALDASRTVIEKVAKELDIDLDAAEYTFTVAKNEEGKISIYKPSVMSYKGEACLVWGKVRKPLSTVPVPYTLEVDGTEKNRYAVMQFELSDSDIRFTLRLPRDSEETVSSLRRAMRAGDLGKFLAASFEKPKSLAELELGDYKVVSYKENTYNGDLKFMIEIEGQGWYKANSTIHRALIHKPVISEDKPASLSVYEATETTSAGHPIIPVDFITADYDAIEVFDF